MLLSASFTRHRDHPALSASEQKQTQEQRCGYVALLGKPNAGKSTLLNACLGQKLAGVCRKPQTTRHQILGVTTNDHTQIIFLDTPGMHRSKRALPINRLMNRAAWSSINEADAICYLVDLTRGWTPEDTEYFREVCRIATKPLTVCITKVDRVRKHLHKDRIASVRADALQSLDSHDMNQPPLQFLSVSAKLPDSVAAFKSHCENTLPVGPFQFAHDDLTNRSQHFITAEIIREKIFRNLNREIPYGTSVLIDGIKMRPQLVDIEASIVVNRATHKPIVIGRGGAALKRIGTEARRDLELHFDQQVALKLFVRVEESWVDNAALVDRFQKIDPE